MRLTARVPVTAGLLSLLLISATGCQRLRANDQINKGVAAFKNAKFEEAEDHFQRASEMDPDNPNAVVFLCTTYSSQIVPNLNSPDNNKLSKTALDCFHKVLDKTPDNVIALKQIASIDRTSGHPDEAKDYEKKVITLSPNDAEAYYTIGAVDWQLAYNNALAALQGEGLTDKGDGNLKLTKPACNQLSIKNTPLVAEGTEYLKKAVDINPNYEEALTFLSLTARRKADLECGNIAAIKADLETSDSWGKKSMDARKANELKKEEKNKGGVAM